MANRSEILCKKYENSYLHHDPGEILQRMEQAVPGGGDTGVGPVRGLGHLVVGAGGGARLQEDAIPEQRSFGPNIAI